MLSELEKCGCGKTVKFGNKFINGHTSKETKLKALLGRINSSKWKESIKKHIIEFNKSDEGRRNSGLRLVAYNKSEKHRQDAKLRRIVFNKSDTGRSIARVTGRNNLINYNKSIEHKNYMLDGGAAKANAGNKNPSKPQVELFNLTKSLFNDAEINFPFLNYSIDVAIPSLKIAIEYDGSYWHRNTERDAKRQLELEKYGWKFIRYRDYIPTKKEIEGNVCLTKEQNQNFAKFVENVVNV